MANRRGHPLPHDVCPSPHDSPGERFPRGTIPQGDDPPGGRSPRGMTPRGPVVKDAALGTQRSWVRIPPPPPPALGPKSDRGGHECCEADFGSRIKILGHPLGQSASFFEIYLFRPVPGSPDGGDGANITWGWGRQQPGSAQGSLVQPCAGLGRTRLRPRVRRKVFR